MQQKRISRTAAIAMRSMPSGKGPKSNAQPNQYSLYGNLLGDFIAGADLESMPNSVLQGLENHKLVDRFTDSHDSLKPLKELLSKERKRFSGIMSDVVFDYFLIKHWEKFSDQDIHAFVQTAYV